jgi:hypothetical protein
MTSNSRIRAINSGYDVNDGAYGGRLCGDPANLTQHLPESLRRALEIRVSALEEEQAADIHEFDELYVRSDQLSLQIIDRQQRLRRFREILIARGTA